MPEAYRGLTIRIGADERNLAKSLTTISTAARQAQSYLTKVNRALKLNPSSTSLQAEKLGLLANKAEDVSRSISRMNRGLKNSARSTSQFDRQRRTVAELARDTKNATLQYGIASDKLTSVNTKLEQVHDSAGKWLAGSKATRQEIEKQQRAMSQLSRDASRSSEKYAELREYVRAAFADMKPGKLKRLMGTSDVEKAVKAWEELRAAQKGYAAERDTMREAKDFQQMVQQVKIAVAETKQLAREQAAISSQQERLGHSTGIRRMRTEMEGLGDDAQEAARDFRRMREAYEMFPQSKGAAKGMMNALKAEVSSTTKQLDKARAVLDRIRTENAAAVRHAASSGSIYEDARKAEREWSQLKYAVQQVDSEFREAKAHQEALLSTPGIDKYGAEYREAVGDVRRLRGELERVTRLEQEAAAKNRVAQGAVSFRNAENDVAAYEARLHKLNGTLRGASSRIGETGGKIRTFGYGIYSTVTPALMTMGYYAVHSSDEIDAAYRDMRKTVEGSEEDFEALKQSAIDFSRTHVTSPDQMLEIQAMGGQLNKGMKPLKDGQRELDAFSKAVSDITVATTITDASEAAERLGQMSNVMRDMRKGVAEGDDVYRRFADTLVHLGNNSATTEDKIMNVSQRVASAGTLYGMTTPQVMAWGTAVASTGQGAEAAGTAISKTWGMMEVAVSRGGKAVKGWADAAQMSSKDFIKAWKDDPSKAFLAFEQGLAHIDKSGGSVVNTLSDLGINSQRQRQALQSLTTTVDDLPRYLDLANKAWNEGGQASDEATKKAQGFSGQLAIMQNNAKVAASELADGFAPILKGLNGAFQGATGALHAMPAEAKTAMVGLGGALALLGPSTIFLGSVLSSVDQVKKAVGGMPDAWRAMVKGASVLSRPSQVLKALTGSAEAAEGAVSGFGSASGAVAAGPVVALAAIIGGTLLYNFHDYVSAAKDAHGATKDLATVSREASGAVGGLIGTDGSSAFRWAKAIGQARDNLHELAKNNDEMGSSLTDMFTKTRSASTYARNIREILDGYKGTSKEVSALKSNISLFNDVMGTSFEVTDDATGAIRDAGSGAEVSAKKFGELASQTVNLYKAEAYGKLAAERMKEQIEAEQKLAESKRAVAEAWERADSAPEEQQDMLIGKAKELEDAYKKEREGVDQLKSSTNQLLEAQQLEQAAADRGKGSIEQFIASRNGMKNAIWENQQSVTGFVETLNGMGITQEQLSQMTPKQLKRMAKGYDGTRESIEMALNGISLTQASIDKLGKTQIGTKRFVVTDDGTVYTEDGKLTDLDAMQIGNKTYLVNDDGSIAWQKGQVKNLRALRIGKKTYYVSDDGTVRNAKGRVVDLDKTKIIPKKFTTSDNGTTKLKKKEVEKLDRERINHKSFNINANNSNAMSKIAATKSARDGLKSKTITLTVITKRVTKYIKKTVNAMAENEQGNARGGMLNGVGVYHARGGLKRFHASGYIANKPTVVDIAGEAGDEAIIPLSNRRYVRPFAKAVASEIPTQGSQTIVNVNLNYKAGDDARTMARELGRELELVMRRS